MKKKGFVEQFVLPTDLDVSPYSDCLLMISRGVPELFALKSFGLDDSHTWKIDQLTFYEFILVAKLFAVEQIFKRLDFLSASDEESKYINTQSKILMWKSELLIKENKFLHDKIERLRAKKEATQKNNLEKNVLRSLGYSDELESAAYYAKYSTQ